MLETRVRAASRVGKALSLLAFLTLGGGCADRSDLAAGGAVLHGPRGLAVCPTLRPLRPRPILAEDVSCQRTIADASRRYVVELLRAEHACLDTNNAGPAVDGDPIHPCVGLRERSTRGFRSPTDPVAAEAVSIAATAFESALREGCSAPNVARLDLCADTIDEAIACLVAEHWEAAQLLLREQYGDLRPIEEPDALACRAAVGASSRALLDAQMQAVRECVETARQEPSTHAALECLGGVEDGTLADPEDPTTAAHLHDAEASFRESLESACRDEHIPAVDGCGNDVEHTQDCLVCAHRREAILLVQSQFGGNADRATTHFIDWARLQNPVVSWPDRRIKDQVMAVDDGWFYVLGSIGFEEDDPDLATKRPTYVRSRDWKTWEEIPAPEERVGQGGFHSPDLIRHGDRWEVVFQQRNPGAPEIARLFLSTSPDLLSWTPRAEIGTNVLPGLSIIDGALARVHDRTHLLLKWRVEDRPWLAITSTDDLTAHWDLDGRLVADTEHPFHGFAENGQFIEIDGRTRMLATARDPEGFRCTSIYTCSHEPFLYDFARGDGRDPSDWFDWRHKAFLWIPYESWNTVMHANTGFLADWREHDGFFYLSYAGANDSESFQGRGHGKIGLARSRDLMHWRLPGDLRD